MRFLPLCVLALGCAGSVGSAAESGRPPASAAIAMPELKVAPGFEVVRLYTVPRESAGSWISLAADGHGRLYTSDQYGPLYRITLTRDGSAPTVTPLAVAVGGVHGLAWIKGSLYAVAGQKSVSPTGLYRLSDRDGDGELDHAALLQALDGDGEHGPHAVVAAPDGESLYILAGNATRLPPLARSRMPRLWAEDSLLAPLPALMGSETRGILPGGWIARTDLDGRTWELICAGFRNAYALAFDTHGELFTFDSDTEFELNLPWYRPTRVFHAVSGADFGWRRGALKVPESAPDAWPAVIAMGLGSPTAVLSAPGAKFPDSYRKALWVADWSYGKIYALHLRPAGGTYAATREEIVAGLPLPITAMAVNPADGAVYFTTGGRRLQSALYRLKWNGPLPREGRPALPPAATPEATARRALERFHGDESEAAVDAVWPMLASPDGLVRRAARTALESQPVGRWRSRALAEPAPRAALTALLGLARADAGASQPEILAALERLHRAGLNPSLRGEWLRVLSLAFSRAGGAPAAARSHWAAILSGLFPTGQHAADAALLELLVFCEVPGTAERGLTALRGAVTREAQLDFAKSLRVLRATWTPAVRADFAEWLAGTVTWRGGASFARFLQRLRDDAVESAPEGDRPALRQRQAEAAAAPPSLSPLPGGRGLVREWTVDDLTMLAERDTQRRDPRKGRAVFAAVGCYGCHSFDGEGGALGQDLSSVTRRLSVRDLFEAIVEPDRAISDQYGTVHIRLRNGREHVGRIVNLTETGPHLAENLADPSNVVRLAEADILSIEPSPRSLMPPGLLNVLTADEILDLLAFLRTPEPSR